MTNLPQDYRDFGELSNGFSVSSFVHEPILFIDKIEDLNSARLGSRIKSGAEQRKVYAHSINFNWVQDENTIRPLPYDIQELTAPLFANLDPANLSYPEVLQLKRNNEIEVDIDDKLFSQANRRAKDCRLEHQLTHLNANLYTYQENGVAWMRNALRDMNGCILADEMGLGKTLQLIALLLLEPPSPDYPALVVCPTSLLTNWSREIEKFAPNLTYLIHRGNDRTGIRAGLLRAEVVLATYETIVRDKRIFASVDWKYVICDEAQAIKNPESERTTTITSLPRKYSIPVTGTPVENSLLDLWSLSNFAVKGILGDKDEFQVLFPDDEKGAESLSVESDPFVLKRQVSEVAQQLPKRIEIDVPIKLTSEMIVGYEKIRKDVTQRYPKAAALVAVGQLSLYCAHPWLQSKEFESEDWEELAYLEPSKFSPLLTPKIEVVLQLLREAFHSSKKVLLFAFFNNCNDLIYRSSKELNLANVYWDAINGSTSSEDRQRIVDEFTEHPGPGILVLNPKAAGAGLNITAATIVIHYTLNWNPALEMQASARAHRLGQKNPVTIYRLYYEDTVERIMVDRIIWKKNLAGKAVMASNQEREKLLNRALEIKPSISKM